jgi:hypothetical protein
MSSSQEIVSSLESELTQTNSQSSPREYFSFIQTEADSINSSSYPALLQKIRDTKSKVILLATTTPTATPSTVQFKEMNTDDFNYSMRRQIFIWFHVDDLSSAHVYLRIPSDMTIDEIPPELVEECSQLVKENSIKGRKKNNVSVIYTTYPNLHKTSRMDYGEVSYHNTGMIRRTLVESKNSTILNRIKKTKKVVEINEHAQFRFDRDAEYRDVERKKKEDKRMEDARLAEDNRMRAREERYEDFMNDYTDLITYQEDMDENYEDEFM